MDLMKSVLADVKSGKRSFKPDGMEPHALAAFQPVTQRLQSAHRQGLIRTLDVRVSKMRDSHGEVMGAIVTGGLTFEGEQFLDRLQNPPEPNAQEPIVRLKPAIWGMSIDLNALLKRVSNRLRRER